MFAIKRTYQKMLLTFLKIISFLFLLPVLNLIFKIVFEVGILFGTKLRIILSSICV